MLETAVYSRLANFAGLSVLVGSRIYAVRAPQNVAKPYVIFSTISRIDEAPDLDGPSDLVTKRVQIDCWAENPTIAAQVGEQVRKALNGYGGALGGVTVADARLEVERDDLDADVTPILHRRGQDYLITFYEE